MGRRTIVKSYTDKHLKRTSVAGIPATKIPGVPLRPGERPVTPHPKHIIDAQQKGKAISIDQWRQEGGAGGSPCLRPNSEMPRRARVKGVHRGGYPEEHLLSRRASVGGLPSWKVTYSAGVKQVTSKARRIRGNQANAAGKLTADKAITKEHVDDIPHIARKGPIGVSRQHEEGTAGLSSRMQNEDNLGFTGSGDHAEPNLRSMKAVQSRRRTVVKITDEAAKPWERRFSRKKFVDQDTIQKQREDDGEQAGVPSTFCAHRRKHNVHELGDEAQVAGLNQCRKNDKDYTQGMLPGYQRTNCVAFPQNPAGCSSGEVKADIMVKNVNVERQCNTQDRIFGGEKHRPDSVHPDYQFTNPDGTAREGTDAVNGRKFVGTNEKKVVMKKTMNMFADELYKGKSPPAGLASHQNCEKDPTNIDRGVHGTGGGGLSRSQNPFREGKGMAKSLQHHDNKKLSTATLELTSDKFFQKKITAKPVQSHVDGQKIVIAGQPSLGLAKQGHDKRLKFCDRPILKAATTEDIPQALFDRPALSTAARYGMLTTVVDSLKHPEGYPSGSMTARGKMTAKQMNEV